MTLTRYELAAGTPLGGTIHRPGRASGETPRAVLEDLLREALLRPPCVVGFSGGRESSLLLAVATDVARREGLEEPIALTMRFPEIPEADESDWQERVAAHLRLQRWERVEPGDAVHVLGPRAQQRLRRHGLLWPPNVHFAVPALDRARGGTVLATSVGTRFLEEWPYRRQHALLAGRLRPQPRDVGRLALFAAPAPIRLARRRSALAHKFPWLTAAGLREVAARYPLPPAPRRWDHWMGWYDGRRATQEDRHSLGLLAAERGTRICDPFAHPRMHAALGGALGRRGPWPDAALSRSLGGDLLPEAILTRAPTRTEYGAALWGPAAQTFAQTWDGSGVDPELVDADALRAIWSGPPWLHATAVLQAAWLTASCPDPSDPARPRP